MMYACRRQAVGATLMLAGTAFAFTVVNVHIQDFYDVIQESADSKKTGVYIFSPACSYL
jgi:hypothetical protein